MRYSTFFKLSLALSLGLVTTFVIDPLDTSTISTPFCLGIILMCLCLRQSVFVVASTSGMYIVLTTVALITAHQYYVAHVAVSPHPYFWFFQRIGLFLVLCGLAIYVAHYRTETTTMLERFKGVLSKLPSPMILSDASGRIVYANDATSNALNRKMSEIIGANFFDLLLTNTMKGASIRTYFELFDSDAARLQELEMGVSTLENQKNAQVITLGSGSNRVLITVLQAKSLTPATTQTSD